MKDPLIARFADACGATAPLDLRVDLAGGGVLAEGSVDQPFTLVGRDDACDVTLSDPEINLRHVWLQVLGGRVFAVDLGSRTGLLWAGGARGSGWLDVGNPARVGPFTLHLRAPVSDRPSGYSQNYNPLAADTGSKARPTVALEFRNGRRAKDRWSVNRLVTLIGRAPDCKIHLTADDISPYHCGIVSTRSGLWVVDLSGRGVVVNGERMRVAPLGQNAELWVGRFLIGCHYTGPAAVPPRGAPPTPAPVGTGGPLAPARPVPVPPLPAPAVPPEDEVELGAEPEVNGLPASHIMADAFRPWATSAGGPISNPINLTGSGSNPIPNATEDSSASGASEDWSVVPLLRQLADLHGRSVAEFQQTLALVGQMFDRVRREHLPVLMHELTRIHELTAEVAALQSVVAGHALELAAADRARQVAPADPAKPGAWASPSAKTPLPEPVAVPRGSADPTPPSGHAARTAERLRALQQDRAARWHALVALFSGP